LGTHKLPKYKPLSLGEGFGVRGFTVEGVEQQAR
jgi:hypothetical protein